MEAWLHFCGSAGDCAASAEIKRAIRRAGIEAVPYPTSRRLGAGIVCLDEIDASHLDFLRSAGAAASRIIAVAVGPRAPAAPDSLQLLRAGVDDVVHWNEQDNPGAQIAARIERWENVDSIVDSELVATNLVGRSPAWIEAMQSVVEVAHYTDSAVLLSGESGTGKELAARLIHTLSSRAGKGQLVTVDCTNLLADLSGSELFGHERGAYTGAVGRREGAFSLADSGTLFLDEIGELPPQLQASLLRVVQEKTFKPVGGDTWKKSDFRLICATNRDLFQQVERGRFRKDLYYRIASWIVQLPPLRERSADILALAEHFLRQARADLDHIKFSPAVRGFLLSKQYPGNARDLKQLIERMAHRHTGEGPVTVGSIAASDWAGVSENPGLSDWRRAGLEQCIRLAVDLGVNLKDIGRTAEDLALAVAIEQEGGNLQRAAKRLGVTDRTLQLRQASRRRSNGQISPG